LAVDADVKKSKSDAEIDVKELYYDVYENNLVLLCPISIKPFSECDFIHIKQCLGHPRTQEDTESY